MQPDRAVGTISRGKNGQGKIHKLSIVFLWKFPYNKTVGYFDNRSNF